MDGIGNGEKAAYVAAALAMVGIGVWGFYRVALGKPPASLPTGTPVVSPDPGQGQPCIATAQWDFHLRPSEQTEPGNERQIPRGTRAVILRRGSLTRRGASIYQIRLADGREGWAFFFGNEISGACAPTGTAGSNPSGAASANAPSTNANATETVVVNGD